MMLRGMVSPGKRTKAFMFKKDRITRPKCLYCCTKNQTFPHFYSFSIQTLAIIDTKKVEAKVTMEIKVWNNSSGLISSYCLY